MAVRGSGSTIGLIVLAIGIQVCGAFIPLQFVITDSQEFCSALNGSPQYVTGDVAYVCKGSRSQPFMFVWICAQPACCVRACRNNVGCVAAIKEPSIDNGQTQRVLLRVLAPNQSSSTCETEMA